MMRKHTLLLALVPFILFSCKSSPEVVDGTMFSLLPEDFPIIRVERGGFSPNGDGVFDNISFYPEVGRQEALETWLVEIKDADGDVVREFSGRAPVVDTITWNGLDDAGQPSNVGLYSAHFQVSFGPNDIYSAETAPFSLVLDGPEVTLSVEDGAFSPDGDGVDDTYIVGIDVADPESVASWEILIRDPVGTPFFVRKELGVPPSEWIWDGRGANGTTALSGADYPISLIVKDIWGNETFMDWQVHIDVLVISDGDRYIISLSRIIFQPYTADFLNVGDEERRSNEKTLDQVASILKTYSNYQVTLVGHAVHVYWFRPTSMAREQKDILLPLSLARANAIRDALIARGIDASRMTTEGRGGAEPIVPHSDLRNRWKNRRVVFFLTP